MFGSHSSRRGTKIVPGGGLTSRRLVLHFCTELLVHLYSRVFSFPRQSARRHLGVGASCADDTDDCGGCRCVD